MDSFVALPSGAESEFDVQDFSDGKSSHYVQTQLVSVFLQDLQKVEAKLQEKLLREKEDEERQRRIVAKLKDKVKGCNVSQISQQLFQKHVLLSDSGGRPCK